MRPKTMSVETHETIYSGPVDEVAAAIGWHDGDLRATISTLLGDCRHLREQLALVDGSRSIGFARGWRPSTDRD